MRIYCPFYGINTGSLLSVRARYSPLVISVTSMCAEVLRLPEWDRLILVVLMSLLLRGKVRWECSESMSVISRALLMRIYCPFYGINTGSLLSVRARYSPLVISVIGMCAEVLRLPEWDRLILVVLMSLLLRGKVRWELAVWD
jgi:hypothetical protein